MYVVKYSKYSRRRIEKTVIVASDWSITPRRTLRIADNTSRKSPNGYGCFFRRHQTSLPVHIHASSTEFARSQRSAYDFGRNVLLLIWIGTFYFSSLIIFCSRRSPDRLSGTDFQPCTRVEVNLDLKKIKFNILNFFLPKH